jgi:hypothetical protein
MHAPCLSCRSEEGLEASEVLDATGGGIQMKTCVLFMLCLLMAFFILLRVEVPTKIAEKDYDAKVTAIQLE